MRRIPTRLRAYGDRYAATALLRLQGGKLLEVYKQCDTGKLVMTPLERKFPDGSWVRAYRTAGEYRVEAFVPPRSESVPRKKITQTQLPPKCHISLANVSNALLQMVVVPKGGVLPGRFGESGVFLPIELARTSFSTEYRTWAGSNVWKGLGPEVYDPSWEADEYAEYSAFRKYYDGLWLTEAIITPAITSIGLQWGMFKRLLALRQNDVHHWMRETYLQANQDVTAPSDLRSALEQDGSATSLPFPSRTASEWKDFFAGQPTEPLTADLADYYDVWVGYLRDPNTFEVDEGGYYYFPYENVLRPARPLEAEVTCVLEAGTVDEVFSGTPFEFSPQASRRKFKVSMPGQMFTTDYLTWASVGDNLTELSGNGAWKHLLRIDVKGGGIETFDTEEIPYEDNIEATADVTLGQSASPSLGVAVYPFVYPF